MIRVRFYDSDSSGIIVYHSKTKELRVSHPNARIRDRIRKYLTTKRRFTTGLPNTKEIGIQLEMATPTDNINFFEMALCELYSKTGLWVDWSDSEGGSTTNIETQEDSSILKSLDSTTTYNIVNK